MLFGRDDYVVGVASSTWAGGGKGNSGVRENPWRCVSRHGHAIGRKNWLIAGNDAAAENHARLWSLIGTTPRDELEQFLPDVWKREDAAEPMQMLGEGNPTE